MVLFGLLLGIAAAEIITRYWKSRYPNPPRIYAFNRRIHHGEIGIFLAVTSLLLRGTSIPSTAAAILEGIGIGLVKDDYLDLIGLVLKTNGKNRFHMDLIKYKLKKIVISRLYQ